MRLFIMKIGIYISGLGQSFENESVEKYAARLVNEIEYNTKKIKYSIKSEKISYRKDRFCTVVSILKEQQNPQVIYKLYSFNYHEILTEKFISYALLLKSFYLLVLVITKVPILVERVFIKNYYNRPGQTLYIFGIFGIIALATVFMIPNLIVSLQNDNTFQQGIITFKNLFSLQSYDIPFISVLGLKKTMTTCGIITSLIVLVIPNANTLVTTLATEFVCANNYLEFGLQRQEIQGNLEKLVDYISENEDNPSIHFHTYSFGSILALDYIFPFGANHSNNAKNHIEALITIGTPFEFIQSYYPDFYKERKIELGNKILWVNIYSIVDALATNFRTDAQVGEAQFGMGLSSNRPINFNYEANPVKTDRLIDFLFLYSIRVHGTYWDSRSSQGKSCLCYVYEVFEEKQYFSGN